MKIKSAKAKGRRFTQWTMEVFERLAAFPKGALHVTSASTNGSDITGPYRTFPFSVECKNQKKPSLQAAFNQAEANLTRLNQIPIAIVRDPKKKNYRGLVVLDLEDFVEMWAHVNLPIFEKSRNARRGQ